MDCSVRDVLHDFIVVIISMVDSSREVLSAFYSEVRLVLVVVAHKIINASIY